MIRHIFNATNVNNSSTDWIGSISVSSISQYDIQIPNLQRLRDETRVEDIIQYQIHHFKQSQQFNFLGVISIHHCHDNNTYYLIDGQHRFEAMKAIFQKTGHDIIFAIELIHVQTMDHVKRNYDLINQNTLLPEFPETIDKNIPEQVALYFKHKYPDTWSKASRPHRPQIYWPYFQEALGVLVLHGDIQTSLELRQLIETHNQNLCTWDITTFPDHKNISEEMVAKCRMSGFYLGLYKHVSDEFRFKWVNDILYLKSGKLLKAEKKGGGKKSIPKVIREEIWKRYVGDLLNVYCICCNMNIITAFQFQAGHIISTALGGATTSDNILPICSSCNLSMSTMCMNDFVHDYFPQNETSYQLRKYRIAKEETTKKKEFSIMNYFSS
jgi:hypothetical protein